MTKKFCCCIALVLAFQLFAAAADNPPQIRINDLSKNPIVVGPFRITISKLKATRLLGTNGTVALRIDNTTSSFATFSPSRLVFVSNVNYQINVFGIALYKSIYNPGDIDLAPGAYIDEQYTLTDEIQLPAKFYYDRHLVAEITK
ncbi:MAG TPA: hypothetical protein VIH58_08985 [Chthoniobacterales bacterium]|jgi:hypothetical protein